MNDDPRVAAVAEALHASEHAGEITRSCPAWDDAATAVAALDAYDGAACGCGFPLALTAADLDAIEARAEAVYGKRDGAVVGPTLSEREQRALDFLDSGAVDDLIAALREAWAEIGACERRLESDDRYIVALTADRDEWKDTATTLRGLLDGHAHNDQAMNDALLIAVHDAMTAVTAERDEARAEVERWKGEWTNAMLLADEARAALDRVRALCDQAERNYGGSPGMANLESWVHLGSLRAALDGVES